MTKLVLTFQVKVKVSRSALKQWYCNETGGRGVIISIQQTRPQLTTNPVSGLTL